MPDTYFDLPAVSAFTDYTVWKPWLVGLVEDYFASRTSFPPEFDFSLVDDLRVWLAELELAAAEPATMGLPTLIEGLYTIPDNSQLAYRILRLAPGAVLRLGAGVVLIGV